MSDASKTSIEANQSDEPLYCSEGGGDTIRNPHRAQISQFTTLDMIEYNPKLPKHIIT